MATFRGTGILFGIPNMTVSSSSVLASCSFQSRDYSNKVTEETVKNCVGEIVTQITYNSSQELTCDYVFTDGTNSGTAAVVTFVAGDVVTVASSSIAVANGTWLVQDVSIKSTNSSATIVSLRCSRYPSITYT